MKRELKLRERLWREATGHCIYCGHPVSLEEMEVDHIVPKSRGGGNGFGNKVCSCPCCNAQKGDATLEDFLQNNMNKSQQEKYLNRLDTLVEQGKMTFDKALSLSGAGLTEWQEPCDGRQFDRERAEITITIWQIRREKI